MYSEKAQSRQVEKVYEGEREAHPLPSGFNQPKHVNEEAVLHC